MKQHYPSGITTNSDILTIPIPKYWTAEQALAVAELLQDLQAVIAGHYGSQMMEVLKEDRVITTVTEQDIRDMDNF